MITITKTDTGWTEFVIDGEKLEQLRKLLATRNSIWGALMMMNDEGAFSGLDARAMIEIFRISERLKRDPKYMTTKQQSS